MQIFTFTQNPDLKTLIDFECRENFNIKPVFKDSWNEFSNIVEILSSVDILIIDNGCDEPSMREVESFIKNFGERVKNIFIFCNVNRNENNIHFFSNDHISEFLDSLKSIIGVKEVKQTEWVHVPLSTLIHFESLPFDLFIKLSDSRYVKRFHAFEVIERKVVSSLIDKGVNEIFCNRNYRREFSMLLINNLINKLEKSYSDISSEISANCEVFRTTKEIIQNLGITGRVSEVCEATVEKMIQNVMKSPSELSDFLKALKHDKLLDFHFKLINLTNYIGTQLITEMNLKDFEKQVHLFICSSYFCDMTLAETSFHHLRKESDLDKHPVEVCDAVNFHALKASELVSTRPDIPDEVAIIIRQHHGSFVGIRLPNDRTSQLHPLAKILIVAQDLAYTILTHTDTPAMEVLKGYLKKNKFSALIEIVECMGETLDSDDLKAS